MSHETDCDCRTCRQMAHEACCDELDRTFGHLFGVTEDWDKLDRDLRMALELVHHSILMLERVQP